jgi:aspartyl/asparaginyl beta-hydroxylase (cupin superfamily)
LTFVWTIGGIAVVLGVAVALLVRRIQGYDSDRKRLLIKETLRDIFYWLEDHGLIEPSPGFLHHYHSRYPKLALLEENYDVVREECEALLGMKQRITDISALGGSYTDGGIHSAQWKSFVFKSGDFIEENCRLAPRTTEILRQIPGVYTAFFSILEPHQYITPHWGYYRGFVRYHLGVIIPHDNSDQSCWPRVNDSREDNAKEDKALVENGERHNWKNGKGIVFDDTNLHDAENGSDEIRVVFWLDVIKKLPFYLQVWNRFFLWLAHRDESVRKIRDNARIKDEAEAA